VPQQTTLRRDPNKELKKEFKKYIKEGKKGK
jgi:hypothetical protein